MQAQPSALPWLGPVLPSAEVYSLVPKCLGSEMSWVRSVLTPDHIHHVHSCGKIRVCGCRCQRCKMWRLYVDAMGRVGLGLGLGLGLQQA